MGKSNDDGWIKICLILLIITFFLVFGSFTASWEEHKTLLACKDDSECPSIYSSVEIDEEKQKYSDYLFVNESSHMFWIFGNEYYTSRVTNFVFDTGLDVSVDIREGQKDVRIEIINFTCVRNCDLDDSIDDFMECMNPCSRTYIGNISLVKE